jgi:hypothetical protein
MRLQALDQARIEHVTPASIKQVKSQDGIGDSQAREERQGGPGLYRNSRSSVCSAPFMVHSVTLSISGAWIEDIA